MIEICNLFKQYEHQPLFKDLHLVVEKGSVVAIIGPSGSGKSTLLRCMNGLEAFQKGYISVDDQRFCGVLERGYNKGKEGITIKNIRRKVGMVFQQFNLFPHMSVLHNITVAPMHVLGIQRAEAETHAILYSGRCIWRKRPKNIPVNSQVENSSGWLLPVPWR